MAADAMHDRLLAITLELPGAYEDRPWGSVHCKVDGKIFVGWGRDDDGIMSIGVRTDLDLQAALVKSDPRVTIAQYVGKYGGIDVKLGPKPNWDEVEHFIVDSYRRIAKKGRLEELDALTGSTTPARAAKPAKVAKPRAKPAAKPKPAAAKPRRR